MRNNCTKLKILLVEDNKIAQLASKLTIEKMSCEVDVASTGKEALQKTLINCYDIIFMDIGLEEGIDGFIVTEKIKQNEGLNNNTLIIILTAHTEENYRLRAKEMGMEYFLNKPIRFEQISDIISNLQSSLKYKDNPSSEYLNFSIHQ